MNRNKVIVFTFYTLIILFLASCSTRKSPAPVVDVQGSVPLSKKIRNSIKATEYIVKKGETLYSIAWRSGIDVREIAKINKIPPPYEIFPGQKLNLTNKFIPSVKKTLQKGKTYTEKPKVVKKPIAQIKNQAYGKNVVDKRIDIDQKVRKWVWPTKGKVITYFSSTQKMSKGINIAGKRGQAVLSTADGKVVYAGDALSGYGKLIIVKHNDDYLSAYAHNDHILVKEQQTVKAGDKIAKMGSTDADKVMLHFEVRFRGKSVDPMKYLSKK
ncbi:peptidoglycan DD-metalloendopeptidase family protein [Colwellia sp. RE-S-Sl-9]